ncbi:S8 family serine peptidase [Oxynema sp. CENA135]|uniref:S8 family serine peptidase n=1 Tax=Oxynema sp. CENA135 TaxID=984206 RepID=UPI00190B1EA0|nr:S8 family serine peptidase [Oxynema sp. CENA135]MBK4732617.1 S8 family serine peptidase [Oxynema sp. CENA135]
MSGIDDTFISTNSEYSGYFGLTGSTKTYSLIVGEQDDWYLSFSHLGGAIGAVLENSAGQVIRSQELGGTEGLNSLDLNNLLPGTYSLKITSLESSIDYTFGVDNLTGLETYSGYFVTEDGTVNLDIAYGDKNIFESGWYSRQGMEDFAENSITYYREAARRILSNSLLGGQLTVSDLEDLSASTGVFSWEESLTQSLEEINTRISQTLTMQPGDGFGLMLLPKGTIQEFFENPNLNGTHRPVLSIAPDIGNGLYIRQQDTDDGIILTIEGEGGKQDKDNNNNDSFIYIEKKLSEAIAAPETATEEPQNPPVNETTNPSNTSVEEPIDSQIEEATNAENEINNIPVAAAFDFPEDEVTNSPEEALDLPENEQNDSPENNDIAIAQEPEELKPRNNNIPPKDLDLTISGGESGQSKMLAGTVRDRNGFEDLDRIDFFLQTAGQNWRQISSVTEFEANDSDTTAASFSYEWDEELPPGTYRVKARAYDRAGKTSQVVIESFTVPDNPSEPVPVEPVPVEPTIPETPGKQPPIVTPPQTPALPGEPPNSSPVNLRFDVFPLYTNGEILSFSGGKVEDADGATDLDRIKFELVNGNGEIIDAGEVTEFAIDVNGVITFDFSYDLSDLAPGSYELRAIAYDLEGLESNVASDRFSLISDPVSFQLSDEFKLDAAAAADLNRYSAEELAKTDKWVVWVTPGQSAEQLAASLQAVNLGETGQLPNTYIFKFESGPQPQTSPEYISNLLAETDGIEFAYPEVPVPLKLMHVPEDYLFEDTQWPFQTNFESGIDSNVSAAWDLINPRTGEPVRGKGIVIGIVDDGLEYTHLELPQERYYPELSWDFSDNDSDPLPYSETTFEFDLSKETPTVDGIEGIEYQFPVNLTGEITDLSVAFEMSQKGKGGKGGKGGNNLPNLQDFDFILHSPARPDIDPFDWRSFAGYWWSFPGWHDFQFSQRAKLDLDGDADRIELNLDQFESNYPAGMWKLQIKPKTPFKNEGEMQQAQRQFEQLIQEWSLKIETANPHGTSVAGIALPEENGEGLVGVSPKAGFAGLRLIGNTDAVNPTYDSEGWLIASALFDGTSASTEENRNHGIDIFNNSWGPQYMREIPLALSAIERGSQEGRDGLGNIYVFSAGNDGANIGNINYNNLANSRGAIAVGAITRDYHYAPYSTGGASIFISAFSDNASEDYQIPTTTVESEFVGDFGGTSAAAPFVSGIIALMLEMNPDLTTRDVQHILAKTAYKNDPEHPDWQENGGGYHVNPHYGFGAVDPVAAVTAAKDWTPVAEEVRVSAENKIKNVFKDILDSQGTSDSIKITEDISVEHAEVLLNLAHGDWKDLKIVLKSPDGTESHLMKSIGDDPYGIGETYEVHPKSNYWTMTSVRHWGESSQGDWTLEIYDENDNQIEGELISWQLNLYGTKPTVNITATQPNASESGTPGEFTVTRTGNSKNALTVNYQIAGTATNGDDYQPLTGTVVIPAGETSTTIDINAIKDSAVEEDETIELTLSEESTYVLGNQNNAVVTIEDSLPLITLEITDALANENGNAGQFIVILNREPLSTPITVNYSIGGDATPEIDYKELSGSVTIEAGQNISTVGVIPKRDYELEDDETITIQLVEGDYEIGTGGSHSIVLSDQHPINTISNEAIGRDVHRFVEWESRWQNGESLEDLRPEIIEAAGDDRGNKEIETAIAQIFEDVLGRDVEVDELDYWRSRLEAGATLAQVRQEINTIIDESIELIDTTQPIYTNPNTGNRYVVSSADSWLGAQEQAKALGGNLVIINDADEQNWLLETFGKEIKYWLGLTDSEIYGTQEGSFKWVDGSPISYLNWHPSEPNNKSPETGGEDFVHMNHNIENFPNEGVWNDSPNHYEIAGNGELHDISRLGLIEIKAE